MRKSLVFQAFSLIELLIVTAILAILTGILLPALGKAKATARRSVCAMNLKQFGSASLMYADDYQGYYPVTIDADFLTRWPYLLAPYLKYDWDNRTTKNNASVFHCPDGDPVTKWANVTLYQSRGYAYNKSVTYNNLFGTGNIRTLKSSSDTFLMMDFWYDEVSNATATFYKVEGYLYGGSASGYYLHNSGNIKDIAYRHQNALNCLFADGHVGFQGKGPWSVLGNWLPSGVRFYNTGVLY